jgi:DNA processing protein
MTTTELTSRQALMVLNALPHIGPITLNRILSELGSDPREVFTVGSKRLEEIQGVGPVISATIGGWREHFDLAREEERMHLGATRFITACDTAYPKRLREIDSAPIGLYLKGNYTFTQMNIAIVGSRRTTLYGLSVAKKLGSELAKQGFCVVSGLARGIDTAAHEGALSVGGKTVAVLGNGIDIIFPAENLGLYRQISETGALLSEFPFTRRADKQSFAMRNRIVSGMSDAVVVVESGASGGAMITARFAGEQGRLLFAVPGRIDQPSSAGCHQLIRDGATLLTCVDDILTELNYLDGLRPAAIPEKITGGTALAASNLTPDERLVYGCFSGGALISMDQACSQTGLATGQLSASLMMLELKRLIVKRADGTYEAR